MEPLNKQLIFKPGQFIFISINSKGISKEQHPFSITSNPANKNLSLAVKSLGDYTNKLKLLSKDSTVEIEGPYGHFSHTNIKNPNQIWIAGGIGITPFLSMARSLSQTSKFDIDLFYSVRNESEAVYLDELKEIANNVKSFRIYPLFSDKAGKITVEYIDKVTKDMSIRDIFICGPLGMMQSLRKQLVGLGIANNKIHTEEFTLY